MSRGSSHDDCGHDVWSIGTYQWDLIFASQMVPANESTVDSQPREATGSLLGIRYNKPGFELLSPFVLESKRARGELGL
jgi:hypothetical protein